MSYDLRVAVKVEGCEKYAEIAEPRICSSPTYNLGKMFRSCTGWDFVQGEYYKCSDVIGKIEHGIEELENTPERYKKYEPSNKWGTVPDALQTLVELRDCIREQAENYPLDCLYAAW